MAECRDEKRVAKVEMGLNGNENDGRERPGPNADSDCGRVNDGEAVNEQDDSCARGCVEGVWGSCLTIYSMYCIW